MKTERNGQQVRNFRPTPEFSFSEPNLLDAERRQTLHWPADIRPVDRFGLKAGFKSFLHGRDSSVTPAFSDQLVQIRHIVLACAGSGRLLLKWEDGETCIDQGQSVIINRKLVSVTEEPPPDCAGRFFYFHFNDQVMARAIPSDYALLARFHRFATHPAADDVIPITRDLLKEPLVKIHGLSGILSPMLIEAFNSLSPGFLKLVLNQLVIPSARIQIFLDRLVLLPRCDHAAAIALFPGGKNALRREMTKLGMPTVAEIVTKRRNQLYKTWRAKGVSDVNIRGAFKVRRLGRIVDSLTPSQLGRVRFATAPCVGNSLNEEADLTDTGFGEIFKDVNVSVIPGLEDYESLLKPAMTETTRSQPADCPK